MVEISRNSNRITVEGDLRDFHYLLAQIHQCIEVAGYSDVILDMSACTSAFQSSMLSVCAQVAAYRKSGVAFSLIPPRVSTLSNLFKNTNWAHFLDPLQFHQSNFRGHTRIAATQYQSPEEQGAAVNRIVNVMLGALPDLERTDFAAFEWAINEITDNVLVHAKSPIGGLVQVSTFQKGAKSVQFVVADAGIGIPASLKPGHPEIRSDTEALDWAIREGVTRDARIGQGNGLFGSYRVSSKSKGHFQIDSGYARLEYNPKRQQLSISNQTIPYSGTLIAATIDFSNPKLLADALQFKGVTYRPTDYVEFTYEGRDGGPVSFILRDECTSFGSRVSGKPVRQKLHNIIRMTDSRLVNVDFSGVPVISSSFADEAFGKLFLQLGPMQFMQRVRLVNTIDTVESLINRAIEQRMKVGLSDADA
jgi:anti-sigma regulatory factor (Ser/Thr protein kinase)